MQHLNIEDLARLVDEEPSGGEAAHLASCRICAEELEEMREQTRCLAGLPDREAPPAQWAVLRSRLVAEGLVATPRFGGSARRGTLLRVAAALTLFVAGGLSAELIRGSAAPAGAGSSVAGSSNPTALVARTPAEAGDQLREAEQLYLAALTRYSELTDSGEPVDPLTRLAALEGIVLTAQAALREAPADPVINGYLLTAMGQREAMLRQISRTSDQNWF
jgi:hypothetical protein